jgi:hypothetical protein
VSEPVRERVREATLSGGEMSVRRKMISVDEGN